jgi:hypothetical protein
MLNEVMRAEEWHGTTLSEQCCWLLLCETKGNVEHDPTVSILCQEPSSKHHGVVLANSPLPQTDVMLKTAARLCDAYRRHYPHSKTSRNYLLCQLIFFFLSLS